ncbi:MAG: CapA family protein [Spirochaetia bacterium]
MKKKKKKKNPSRKRLTNLLRIILFFPVFLLLNCSDTATELYYDGNDNDKYSCTDAEAAEPILRVRIDKELDEIWDNLKAPPAGIEIELNTAEEENVIGELLIEKVSSLPDISEGEAEYRARKRAEGETPDFSRTLRRSYIAPAVPLWDTRRSVSLSEALDSEQMDLKPIEEIEPPLKALRIDGMRIDDPEYPLVDEVRASFYLLGDSPYHDELKAWFTEEISTASVPPEIISVGGVGDIMLERGIEDILISKGGEEGLSYIFGDSLHILRTQDILVGNLEGAVTRSNAAVPKSYNFKFRPEVLPYLKSAGFDYLSITNNHCYDYGEKGFLDTLNYLKEYGLATSGAGENKEEALRPSLFEPDVHVLSAGDYPRENNGFDGREEAQAADTRPGILFSGPEVLEAIDKFSSPETIDVVAVHGGEEWHSRPVSGQKEFYRSCIDAGADLVLGSHPHVLQGLEGYKGGLIAYSLGNFLFPGMYVMQNAEDSLILSVGFAEGRPLYVEPYPIKINNRRIETEKDGTILTRLSSLTKELHNY